MPAYPTVVAYLKNNTRGTRRIHSRVNVIIKAYLLFPDPLNADKCVWKIAMSGCVPNIHIEYSTVTATIEPFLGPTMNSAMGFENGKMIKTPITIIMTDRFLAISYDFFARTGLFAPIF